MSFVLIIFFVSGCSSNEASGEESSEVKIGILMPSKALERWEKDGDFMVRELEKEGYTTSIQYAQDDVPTQVNQIENMISMGADLLIVAPIDGAALSSSIDLADSLDIPVIAYDRLILHSDGIDYYATYDNYRVGQLQGQYIVDSLGLDSTNEIFNIELFGGAPDDNNARYFYDGAMDILTPYIESGQLVVQSGQTAFNTIAIENWDSAQAQSRMDNLISSSYSSETLDAILAPNDAIALGVVSSLQSVGYGSEDRPMPIITGQDAEMQSVKSIVSGNQTMTVFKDTQALAEATAKMAKSIIDGEEVAVNDTETYDNGIKVVPSLLLEPVAVDITNYEEILLDSGYISESDLN